MKEIIYIYIYICQGLIAALFTTLQGRQPTVGSKYHAICWYGSSLAAVGTLLSLPSDARATREGMPRNYSAGGTSPSQTYGACSIPLTESAPLIILRATGEANISTPCGPEPIPMLPPRAASVMAPMTSDDGCLRLRTPSCTRTCPTRQSLLLACCGDWGD